MDQLRQEVNQIKTDVAVLVARFSDHCDNTEKSLDGIIHRLDNKVNGKFDEHARLLTEHATSITNLATSLKETRQERERRVHELKRATDRPKAFTVTIDEEVIKKVTRTLVILLVTLVTAIAAAMMGVPVPIL